MYDFEPLLEFLFEWIKKFRLDENSAQFRVKMDKNEPSLYGICDMVYNLVITKKLKTYMNQFPKVKTEDWITEIQSYQDPKTGWFREGKFNYNFHFKEHSTAFAVAALDLLRAKPRHAFKIAEKLDSKKKVEKWLKKTPEWGLLYWPGSHRGGGIGAIFATLGEKWYPHKKFFSWYFNWLDKHADPDVGFWRIGWIHKLKRDRLTKNELGGAVHYFWIYEFLDHPIPFPERVIDATLTLQNKWGTWDELYSYCIDLDALFCLTRCCKQTDGYRKDDIKMAILKYLDYIVEKINKRDFFFKNYQSAHTLTGFLSAIAEINKFMPDLFQFHEPWIQSLDITPWI